MTKNKIHMNIIKNIGFRISNLPLKKAFSKLIELALTGIVFAIVASLLTADIIDRKEQQRTINNQLSNLSNVYIGCSKQWTDEAFGHPQFVGQKKTIYYVHMSATTLFYRSHMIQHSQHKHT